LCSLGKEGGKSQGLKLFGLWIHGMKGGTGPWSIWSFGKNMKLLRLWPFAFRYLFLFYWIHIILNMCVCVCVCVHACSCTYICMYIIIFYKYMEYQNNSKIYITYKYKINANSFPSHMLYRYFWNIIYKVFKLYSWMMDIQNIQNTKHEFIFLI
jgi:hypothetical protein